MAMFIVQVSFGFQLPGLRRHKGFPISEGGGTGEMISRKGMMRLIMIKILLMVLIKLLIILTIKLIMYLVMLYVLLMMAAMIKKKLFFQCLAHWKEGSTYYFVAMMNSSHVDRQQLESSFRLAL